MKVGRTPHTEQLYAHGLELLRAARWDEAVRVLSELREISSAYPEVDALLADALLKIEIERATMPDSAAAPKKPGIPLLHVGATLMAALVIGGGAFMALKPGPSLPLPSSRPTIVASLPTPAPTSTAEPTSTPRPTATPLPTATPPPTATPQPGTLVVRAAGDQPLTRTIGNIEIILDASGSMLARVDGQRKIDIAHNSLAQLVEKLPSTTNVALRAYGHRHPKDCQDIELLSPLAQLDRTALLGRISAVVPAPNGMTPIGLSLQQVAEDLRGEQGDAVVLLVSDGEETCDSDPAQIATQLHTSNPRLRIDVIGFNVGPEDSRARLGAIAQGGGGNYFDASDAVQLVQALQQAVALTYRVLDAQGAEVYRGTLGSSTQLPGGRYSIEISGSTPLTVDDIFVGDGKQSTVELHEQDGALQASVTR